MLGLFGWAWCGERVGESGLGALKWPSHASCGCGTAMCVGMAMCVGVRLDDVLVVGVGRLVARVERVREDLCHFSVELWSRGWLAVLDLGRERRRHRRGGRCVCYAGDALFPLSRLRPESPEPESSPQRESKIFAFSFSLSLILPTEVIRLCDRHRPSSVHPYRVGVPVVGRTVFRLPINVRLQLCDVESGRAAGGGTDVR